MTVIPFSKFHGDENDFLITWGEEAPDEDLEEMARRICARNTGIGADGWMLAWRAEGGLRTRLFNSDGSEPEISGNGTRCAAAFALMEEAATPPDIFVTTAAGRRHLRLLSREAGKYLFEMDMGIPAAEDLHRRLSLAGIVFDAAILNVGNPQCAIFVDSLPENWRAVAAEAEGHPMFPKRSNVSFVKVVNRHVIEAVFYERGAGETRSSGTGSTGAGAAAILRGEAESPLEIRTPAGTLSLRWDASVYLTGPVEFVGEGRFSVDF